MPIINDIFARIWKFVDQRAAGDDVTRADLDIAFDDLAAGVNVAIDLGRGGIGTATLADGKGTTALQKIDIINTSLTDLQSQINVLNPVNIAETSMKKTENLAGLASISLSMRNLFGLAQPLPSYPLHFLRIRSLGTGLEARSPEDVLIDLGIGTRIAAIENFVEAEEFIGQSLRQTSDATTARGILGAASQIAAFGQDQVWRSFTVGTQRAVGTSYQNTTGRPIFVSIVGDGSAAADVQVSNDATTWINVGRFLAGSDIETVSFPIQSGGFYRVASGGGVTSWAEFRHPTS